MNDNDLHGLARMNALAKQLLEDESYYNLPNLRPKDAATLIPVYRVRLADFMATTSRAEAGPKRQGEPPPGTN